MFRQNKDGAEESLAQAILCAYCISGGTLSQFYVLGKIGQHAFRSAMLCFFKFHDTFVICNCNFVAIKDMDAFCENFDFLIGQDTNLSSLSHKDIVFRNVNILS